MVLRRGIAYGPSCAEPHNTLARRVPNAQPSKVLRRSFWRSPGGAVLQDPKCMLLRVVAGRTAPEIQCRARRRQRPSRSLGIVAAANRRAQKSSRRICGDGSSHGSGIAQQFGVRGRSTVAAVRNSWRRTRPTNRATARPLPACVKCFGGDGYPRIALSRNHQRLLMSQRNMGRRSGLDAAGHTSLC